MMHGFGFGNMGVFGGFGMVLNLLITVGLIVGIVYLVAWVIGRMFPSGTGQMNTFGQSEGSQSPREILQIRYARGEITREQYHGMLEDLA